MPVLSEIDFHHFDTIKEQVELATDWVIGGYENAIADGHMKYYELPSCLDLVEEIYSNLLHCHYFIGVEAIGANPTLVHADPALVKSLIARKVVYERPIQVMSDVS